MNTTSRESVSKTDERIDKLADQLSTLVEIVSKNVVTPAPVKVVEEICVTCSGPHAWYNCPNIDNNQASVCAATGSYNQGNPPNRVSNQMAPPGFASVQNNGQNRNYQNQVQGNNFNRGNNFHASTSGTLPSNTIPNPKCEMKAITTGSGVAYEGPSIPTNPSSKRRFAMLLKKLPEKLGDPDKFLIPCNFSGMDVCHVLADLGASINLMPLSIWKKLSLPELTPTRMTFELANRSITHPKGLAEDVYVKVGKFYFPADFVVVDFEVNPQVPLILVRSFLRTDRALIDVYGQEITLRVDNEAITFNLDSKGQINPLILNDVVNYRIDVIDVICRSYASGITGFLKSSGSNLTPTSQGEVIKAKPSMEEPPELELKDLPSHLEYAYLEENNKLPVIIVKALKDNEKDALLKVLKSHKRAIA
ncbi:reverse transcriptase domain-containing protein [Tanacetum coccineum]|uniref:Reverse transcriptase domain-containing protein n=1 Tax=Tanacetum coccineum TaxID=301880 RepID=A0ABQ5CJY0_9ASTR